MVQTLGKMRQRKEILVVSSLMLGIFGTMTFGGEDILGSGDCEASPITPYGWLLTLLFMGPACLSRGM